MPKTFFMTNTAEFFFSGQISIFINNVEIFFRHNKNPKPGFRVEPGMTVMVAFALWTFNFMTFDFAAIFLLFFLLKLLRIQKRVGVLSAGLI